MRLAELAQLGGASPRAQTNNDPRPGRVTDLSVLTTEAPLTANVAAEKAVAIIIGVADAANRQAA